MGRTLREKERPSAAEWSGDLAAWRALHLPGHAPRILTNPEMRAFLDEQLPRMTFEQVTAACRARFGEAAPSLGTIRRYWISRFGPGVRTRRAVKPPRSIVSDPGLRAFIDERLSRLTFDRLAADCRMRFGNRAPSHQTIIRYWRATCRPRLASRPESKRRDRTPA